jgi:ribonuclease J
MARKLGYLQMPDETLIPVDQAINLPAREVVLMCTGAQGEPSSIIGRLSRGSNRQFDIQQGDTVVISSHPIPGNEETISRTINRLFRLGAEVIYDSLAPVHVSGHASQEEQKLLLNLVRPKHFIPMHGELRQLRRHAALAREVGLAEEDVMVIENGQVAELAKGEVRLAERIPGGYVFVEGESVGDVDEELMREREQLSRSGIVLIDVTLDKFTSRLLHPAEIITRGFVSSEDAQQIIASIQKRVEDVVNGGGLDNEKAIFDAVRNQIYNQTKRRPMVFVTMSKA